jgi:hypothetical protein
LLAEQPLGVRLTEIGTFVSEAGLFSTTKGGQRRKLAARGFEHTLDG